MKKLGKRFLTLAITCVMAMAMAVPAFAATTESAQGQSFSSFGNTDFQLNAHTNGTPAVGTKISMWTNTSSNTQRWDPISFPGSAYCWFQNAANKNVVITYNGGSQAVLASKHSTSNGLVTQGIKMVYEGLDSSSYEKRGLVLPTPALCLTASGYSNGSSVNWQVSNGQSNQLWIVGKYN